MKNSPTIVLGTWSWGVGFAGGDQVFGNNLGIEELKPVFNEAMNNGLNLWDSAVVYGMGTSETIPKQLSAHWKPQPKTPEPIHADSKSATANHSPQKLVRFISAIYRQWRNSYR